LDLDHVLKSIVALHAVIPDDAFTAGVLGTRRAGSGVVIRESGLILTIGYLITEAEEIWLTANDGRVTPGHALAYDQATGFGLVQALGALNLPALELGRSSEVRLGDAVVLAGGGRGQYVRSHLVARQEFAGYWEYLIDEALFTAPAHPLWGGTGMISADGKLLGIGSLLVQQVTGDGQEQDINMVVPIDLLPPILEDLLRHGRVTTPPRPWLGIYTAESEGKLVIASLAEGGPGAAAGLQQGDIIAGVRELGIDSLSDFYRKLWDSGPAGTEIPLEVVRGGRSHWVRVRSADRSDLLRKPRLQ